MSIFMVQGRLVVRKSDYQLTRYRFTLTLTGVLKGRPTPGEERKIKENFMY